MQKSKVYFTREITPESLVRIYKALGVELKGKVGVKISSGEPGGNNYQHPELIGELVNLLHGTIVECCTAYGGRRTEPGEHWKAIAEHGFTAAFPCDIMDEFGEMELPVDGGYHLKSDRVGAALANYDSVIVLSHFNGHAMAGMGGALKNISIGIASPRGKTRIHTAGLMEMPEELFGKPPEKMPEQDPFLESMADAGKAVITYKGAGSMLYINVANRLSVDCDCDSHPAAPEMADLGIFASADPVAVDQACYDAVVNAADPGKAALIERMNSRHAIHVVEAAAELGFGSREYELISID